MVLRIHLLPCIAVLLVAGCRMPPDPPEIGASSVEAPASANANSNSNSKRPPVRTSPTDPPVEALEKAYQASEGKKLPPCGPGVKGLCTSDIKTASEIGHLDGERVVSMGDSLPPALHGHGEALRGAWMAPDGTAFLAGYMYTGVPGPDTGVIYRKDPGGGAWKIVYSKKENELGHVWGRSASDVWVAGVTTLAHWDGTSWKEEPIPVREGNLTGVWGTDTDLYVVGGDWKNKGDGGRIFHRDAKGKWTVEAHASSFLYDVQGRGKLLFAVGDHGLILRRGADGKWTDEGKGSQQNTHLYLAADNDLWVAGSKLLHSKGDGQWTEVTLPKSAQVTTVWGRGPDDVYAGTLGGLFHLQGGTWKATEWKHDTEAIAGRPGEVLVANQHIGG